VTALIRVILEIALLRSGPQVLPSAPLLLVILAVAYVASSALLAASIAPDAARVAREVGFDLAVDCLGLWAILAAARRLARYPQTLAAVLGCSTLFNLALLPAVALAKVGPPALTALGAVLLWAVLGWSVAVYGHVLRHALEIGYGLAVGIAVAYMLVGLLAYRALGLA